MEATATQEIEASKTDARITQQIGSITLEALRTPEPNSDEGEHTRLKLTLPALVITAHASMNADNQRELHIHAEGPHARLLLANALRAAVNLLELE